MKSEYTMICGLKSGSTGKWKQVVKSCGGGVVKKAFQRNSSYKSVINYLRSEYHIPDEAPVSLIDMSDKVVEPETFTVPLYVKQQFKYVGSTRIYLGIYDVQEKQTR